MPEIPQFVLDRAQAQEPVFTADEIANWPVGLLEQLRSCGVLAPSSNSKSIACDACSDDHCEEVQFVESPTGSALRAYISCPESGRVRVALERLRRWQVNLEKAIALGRVDGNRSDVRVVHLHYEPGHCAYICIIDEKKRAFDFSTNTFRRIHELQQPADACLFATGRSEPRASFGFSYSAGFDLYRLVANIADTSVPPNGLVFSIQWLLQKGSSPSPKDDMVLPESARIHYLHGRFSSVDTSSHEIFDESISFAKRQRRATEKAMFRDQEFDKHEELSAQLADAVSAADVAGTLRILAEGICFWAKGLRRHLFDHFYFDVQDPSFCQMCHAPPDLGFQLLPSWLAQPWVGTHEAYDLLEFHKSSELSAVRRSSIHGGI